MTDIVSTVAEVAFFGIVAYMVGILIYAKVRMYKSVIKLIENGADVNVVNTYRSTGESEKGRSGKK